MRNLRVLADLFASFRYWDIVTRTIAARPQHAALGGDPSIASHIRAFLNVKFYQSGVWEERLEV